MPSPTTSSGWQLKTSPDTGPRTFGVAVSANSSSRVQRYSNTVLALNTWYFVAGVYDANARTLDIYVNGVLDDGVLSGTVPSSQYTPDTNINIGRRSGGLYFNGTIDEVRIYDRALTQAEIQSDMNTPIGSAAADTQPPIAPSNLTAAAASPNQINLSWTASTDNDAVTGYRVERCQNAGCINFAEIATASDTTFDDTGLTAGTDYTYRVLATDAAGNRSSYSNVAGATTPATLAGLVAAYAFDEGSGATATDASGNGANGTIAGASWTTGKYGNALSFNGVNSYVDLGNPASLNLTGSMTWSAWIYAVANPPDDGQIVAKSDNVSGWQLKTSSDAGPRTFGVAVSRDSNSRVQRYSNTVLTLNTWYFVAGVYDANARTLDIYVNGALDDGVLSGTVPSSQYTPDTNINIGRRSGGLYFNGIIDQVRVYNRALTQAEVQDDMNTPIGIATPDTQAPTPPGNLAAAVSGSQINLNWTASTDNVGVSGYLVERCHGVGCSNFVQIATPATTTFSDPNLTVGSYSYRVRAADVAGNLSAYSNIASGSIPDTQPPTDPSGLSASPISASQIDLNWTASTDDVAVTQYSVERCQGTGCSAFTQVGTSSAAAFSDRGLSSGTAYSYRVRATDAAGNFSGYSNTAGATTSPPSGGLLAGYAFDEGAGSTITDLSGNNITGTVFNTIWTTGKYGGALSFNGAGSYIDLGNPTALQLTGSMTWSAWIYAAADPPDDGQIVAKSNDASGWQFKTSPDTGVETFAIAVSPSSGGRVQRYSNTIRALNTWYYVAGVYNASAQTLDIYVNGQLDNGVISGTAPAAQATPAVNVNIGRRTGGNGYYFNGVIDNLRIYDRALSQAEIQSDMNTPLGVAPDSQPPTAPSNLAATPISSSQIDLSWSASTDDVGVTGYLVESCQGVGCANFTQIGTAPSASFSSTGLALGTSYSYRVRATDAAGNLSDYSTVAIAVTPAPDTTPPSAPSNLTATAVNSSQITLTWTASTDAGGLHGYSIERCLTDSCTFSVISPYVTSITFNDTGLGAGVSYSYRVQASDSAGNLSAYSNIATASTPAVDTQAPTAPTNPSATAVGGNQIDVSWAASTDDIAVTSYLLERCQGNSCTSFAQIASVGNLTYSDSGLSAGVSYTYRVRATDAAGNLSAYSPEVSATTPAVTPGLIAAYGFSEGSGTTTADASGNGLTGSLQNTTWTTLGKDGNALNFNGTSSFVDLGTLSSFPMTSSSTWSAWVFPTGNPPDDGQIIAKSSGNDGWQLKTTPDTGARTFGVAVSNGSGEVQRYSNTVLSLNRWYYVAGVYNAASQTLDIYVNGVLDNGALVGTVPAAQSNPASVNVNIGRRQGGYYFIGTIDDVRVYSRALSQAEIQADMITPVGTAPNAPGVSLTSTTASFGSQATGTTSPAQPVMMTNSGTQDLAIANIVITGANSGDFSQTNDCPPTLAPSADCTIGMTFTPTTTGTRSAFVTITDNAPDSPQTISLTGNGTGFAVSPKVTVLTSTLTQQFTVENGSGAVTWSVDGVSGGSATSGTITSAGLYTPPAAAGNHTVTARTSTSQTASATVYVSNYAGTFTRHNDNFRTGVNSNETVLTRANVDFSQFGKQFSYPTDGISHASPLYVANVDIPGSGRHNVVYVATEHDSVYAFDADGRSTTPLWHVSFINPTAGITTVPAVDTGETGDINPEIGITSTPVIDPASGTLYVVAKTKEVSGGSTKYYHRLHAIDLATGAEKFGGPVALQASVSGTGAGSTGGVLPFDALRENQRPALLLSNGVIYIAFAGHGDQPPYHGWVLGYDATTLQRTMAYCVSPNGSQSGIWQSGMGLSADSAGNVYFMTANGTFNADTGGTEYGDSFIKLNPSGTVVDYFTPKDQSVMDSYNWDLSSSGPMLLPDQQGLRPHLLVSAGKIGGIYLIDRDNMGHFTSDDSQVVQSIPDIFPNGTPEPGNYSSPVYFNGTVYFGPINDRIQAFQLSNGLLTTTPTSESAIVYPYPGAVFAASSNGSSNGVLWAIQRNESAIAEPGNNPAILRAYSTDDLSTELYNSTQAGARDALGPAAKFTVPLVANGRVYVLSQGELTAFGLLP